jgi:hypothetical protein
MKMVSSPMLTDGQGIIDNADQLKIELRHMGKTLSAMPLTNLDTPMACRSSWPGFNQSDNLVASAQRRSSKPIPTAREISDAEYWLNLISRLDVPSRRIVMARAMGITWRRLEEMDGRSHTTLRKIEQGALLKILVMVKIKSE